MCRRKAWSREALGVAPDQLLQRSVRVRSVDGLPFSYLTTHVPESVSVTFTRQELASRPLLELLERAGVKVEHARQRISAGLATPDVAEALGLHTGSPLIELVRVVYDQSGRGVEHLHALYRPDRYAFEIDLVRSGAADTKAWAPVIRRPANSRTTKIKFENLEAKKPSRRISRRNAKPGGRVTMSDQKYPFSRRRFLATTAFGAAAAATGSLPCRPCCARKGPA